MTDHDHQRRRRKKADRDADVIGGWLLGHQLAQGGHAFAGDPLPGGHLGSPASLAFWGGVFEDEDVDDEDEDNVDDDMDDEPYDDEE